jgi:outer membrane receptor protein involved in Fe transport
MQILPPAPPLPVRPLCAVCPYAVRRRTLNGSELGGWGVTNLNLRAPTGVRGLEASLGLRNLFNKRYAEPASALNWQNSLDQHGRSVRLKLDYRF